MVSISGIKIGYKTSLWRYMTKLLGMNKLGDLPHLKERRK